MKFLFYLSFLLIPYFICAQNTLPLTLEEYYVDPDTEEWYLGLKKEFTYDEAGNLVIEEGNYINTFGKETPFKKEQGFNNHNLLITTKNWEVHPNTEELYLSSFLENTYNEKGDILKTYKWIYWPSFIERNRDTSITETVYLYDDNHCLNKVMLNGLNYDETLDTTIILDSTPIVKYVVTSDCRVLTKEERSWKSEFTYDDQSRLKREKTYTWESTSSNWKLHSKNIFTYDDRDLLKYTDKVLYFGSERSPDSLVTKVSYYYNDQANEPFLQIEEKWDRDAQVWCELDKSEYFFDKKGIRRLVYEEDRANECGNNVSLKETNIDYVFNEYDFLTESLYQSRKYDDGAVNKNIEIYSSYIRRSDGTVLEEKVVVSNRLPYWYGGRYSYHRIYTYSNSTSQKNTSEVAQPLCVFPNPTARYITIKSDLLLHPDSQICIYGIDGKLRETLSYRTTVSEQRFDVSFLTVGIYLIEINGTGEIARTKLVITE